VAYGGAQELYKIQPDLTTLGKTHREGAGGGRLLEVKPLSDGLLVAPAGPCYQLDTLSGKSPGAGAGLKTLEICAALHFTSAS